MHSLNLLMGLMGDRIGVRSVLIQIVLMWSRCRYQALGRIAASAEASRARSRL
jgi:hypothetical protein